MHLTGLTEKDTAPGNLPRHGADKVRSVVAPDREAITHAP